MPCQTQTSQQPQQPTTVLPQNLPQTQADWQRFLQRMNELLGSINNAQYATGVNAVPTDYAVYDGTGLPALRITGATSAFDTTHAQFGSGSLKLTATASTVTVELGASGYPVTLHPNWQWIASLFLLTSVTTIAGKLSIVTAAKQYDTDISGSPGASWSRLYGDYDLTADASTSCTLLLTLTGVTVGQVFNLEGWMVEPSQGAVLPSPFIMTSGPRTWAQVVNDGTKPDNNANYVAGVVNSYITELSFASGLQPVNIVSALPALPNGSYPDGSLVVLTTDHKLYRNSANAWTKAVDGADILANSITAGSISAGAVNASAIAAGAVTASAIAAGAVQASAINVSTLSAISANLGTVTAGTLQDSAGKFVVNLAGQTQTIKDGSNVTRVLIGNLGTDYGIQVFNASGTKIFDASQGAWDATNSQPVLTTANNAQTSANTANTTATQAQDQANTMPVINGGFDIAPTGYGWTADAGTNPWYTDTSGDTPGVGPNCARRDGSGTPVTIAYRNNGYVPCLPGQVYKAQGLVRGISSPDGGAAVYISWLNASLTEIGTSGGNHVSGSVTNGSYAVGTAPAGTYYARTCLGVYSHSSGSYLVDNVLCSQYPSSLDEVPNGTLYSRVNATQVLDGVVALLGTGRNAIPNPNFMANTVGSVGFWGYGQQFRDNWTVTANPPGMPLVWDPNIGPSMSVEWNQTVASGAQFSSTFTSSHFAVSAGKAFALRSFRTIYVAGSGTVTSGLIPINAVGIFWYDNAGSYITTSWFEKDGAFAGAYDIQTGTVPSNAATASISLVGGVRNNNSYAATPGNTVESGWTSVQYVEASDLDSEVVDGATYARIYGSELSNGVHKIGVPGSGYQIGDQRNLPAITFSNYGSGWNGMSLSYSSTTTSATVTASAATLQAGSVAISYNAASTTVTGSAGTSKTYYLYYTDATHSGGSQTLHATTSIITALNNDGNVYIASMSVTFPSSGSGGGSGGGGCPLRTAWVIRRGRHGRPQYVRVGKVRVGDWLLRSDGKWAEVTFSRPELQPCVRIVADGFGTLGCSISAPMQTRNGAVLARDCLDHELVVQGRHAVVTDLRGLGDQWVQHITLANAPDDFYLVGDAKDALFAHHNMKPP